MSNHGGPLVPLPIAAAALGLAISFACGTTPSANSPRSLCDELCLKVSACQVNGSVPICTAQCERNDAEQRAFGCGAELEEFKRCMSANIVCKDGDYDAIHIAETCRTPSEALTACEKRDGGPSEGGPG
jgi:hypothetical protein